jgi:hypothetical protein
LILQKTCLSLTGFKQVWKRSGFNEANPAIMEFYEDISLTELAHYLCIVYLTMLSVAQAIERPVVG